MKNLSSYVQLPLLICAALLLTAPEAGAAQCDELAGLKTDFEGAMDTARTADDISGVPDQLTRIIDSLERCRRSRELLEEEGRLRGDAYYLRAVIHASYGRSDSARRDVAGLLEQDPTYEPVGMPQDSFRAQFDEWVNEIVGTVEFSTLDPFDARIAIDGEEVDASTGRVRVIGNQRHVIDAGREGFASLTLPVMVPAGSVEAVEIQLQRTAAVIRFNTRPSGVTVYVDGTRAGVTEARPGDDGLGESEEFVFVVDIGQHDLSLEKEGYRRADVDPPVRITADQDYFLGSFFLNTEEGIINVNGIPSGAELLVDDAPVSTTGSSRQLRLPPGDHRVLVDFGTEGMFEETVNLRDGDEVALDVLLRPGVALLGILGDDRVRADSLLRTLRDGFSRGDLWPLLDRTEQAVPLLESAKLTRETLRDLASRERVDPDAVDWESVQDAFDAQVTGSVYLLAVLDADDTIARFADLWIWPAAPGPAAPDRLRVQLARPESTTRVLSSFSESLLLTRPWLGATVVNALDIGVPTVAAVMEGGPAQTAGLAVGDQILSINGTNTSDSAQLIEFIERLDPGATVRLDVRNAGRQSTVNVQLGSSPVVISFAEPDRAYAALWAAATAALNRGDSEFPDWALQLNLAAAQIHARQWRDAFDTLSSIVGAPTGPGLGQGAIDYWMGVALTGAGPDYDPDAERAFDRAAQSADARLFHNDGPSVRERALARKALIGKR